MTNIPERFFVDPGPTASDVVRSDALDRAWSDYDLMCRSVGQALPLADTDAALFRSLVDAPGPKTRRAAIVLVCRFGPVTWDDLERWACDPDTDIRDAVAEAVVYASDAAYVLCAADLPRCAALLDKIFDGVYAREGGKGNERSDRFGEMMIFSTYSATRQSQLDATWWGAGLLLDLNQPDIRSNIVCGYLENVLEYEHLLGPDDPRLRSWIEGDSIQRKTALLEVINWFGMRSDWMVRIAHELARDSNTEVSSAALSILAFHRNCDQRGAVKEG